MRSRFLAQVHPLEHANQVPDLLDRVRQEHRKARHHVHAWRLGHPERQPKHQTHDDGEPSGTGGLPVLRAIEGSGLSDLLVVVTRYFGGVKLGTGGLARAYGSAAAGALAACPRTQRIQTATLGLRFPYSLMTQVRRLMAFAGACERELESSEDLRLILDVPQSRMEELATALEALFQGRGELWKP